MNAQGGGQSFSEMDEMWDFGSCALLLADVGTPWLKSQLQAGGGAGKEGPCMKATEPGVGRTQENHLLEV